MIANINPDKVLDLRILQSRLSTNNFLKKNGLARSSIRKRSVHFCTLVSFKRQKPEFLT
jgi:hypothetical protein